MVAAVTGNRNGLAIMSAAEARRRRSAAMTRLRACLLRSPMTASRWFIAMPDADRRRSSPHFRIAGSGPPINNTTRHFGRRRASPFTTSVTMMLSAPRERSPSGDQRCPRVEPSSVLCSWPRRRSPRTTSSRRRRRGQSMGVSHDREPRYQTARAPCPRREISRPPRRGRPHPGVGQSLAPIAAANSGRACGNR